MGEGFGQTAGVRSARMPDPGRNRGIAPNGRLSLLTAMVARRTIAPEPGGPKGFPVSAPQFSVVTRACVVVRASGGIACLLAPYGSGSLPL